jgi:general secretion pathway protein M
MMLWWQTLSARERGLLGLGAIAMLATLLFITVLEPLQAKRARLAAQVVVETQTLHRIRALSDEALQMDGRSPQTDVRLSQSLLAVLNDTAQAGGIQDKLARVVPNGEAEASVTFDDVGFDTLVTWLLTLRAQFGVEATRLVIEKTEAGRVNANLTLATGFRNFANAATPIDSSQK